MRINMAVVKDCV